MSANLISDDHFVPAVPVHPQGDAFFAQLTEMLDGQPKEPAVVEAALTGWEGVLEKMASDLYRIASMLLGEGEEAITLIEEVVSSVDISVCASPVEARHSGHLILAARAITLLHQRDAASLAAPAENNDSGSVTCIEDDDLDAVGVSPADLEQMISGPERHRLRDWLEGLTAPLRVIFVLRAVAALSSAEIAGLLAQNASPDAENWTPDAVRATFRQALCSLASQLIHATATK